MEQLPAPRYTCANRLCAAGLLFVTGVRTGVFLCGSCAAERRDLVGGARGTGDIVEVLRKCFRCLLKVSGCVCVCVSLKCEG